MKLLRKAGVTSEIWQIFIQDSSSTTGAGLTGLTNASSGLTAYYHRDTDTTATAISVVSMTVGTFTSGGFKEIDSSNLPGWYQFCPPNAALASGAKSCAFHLKGATNMAPLPIECQLMAVDVDDTVRMGLTALPNVASGSAGAVITSGTGTAQLSVSSGQVILQTGTGTGQLDFTSGVVKANATQWLSGTIPAVNVTGVPLVDAKYLLGTVFSTPATAGIIDVNLKNIANATVSATTAQLGVNVVNVAGSASVGAAGYVAVDMAQALPSTPTANTVGEALFIADNLVGRIGTAQAGAASTITLDSGASSTDGRYVGYGVYLYGGTGGGIRGVGQERTIIAYVGSTKVATVAQAWGTTPDNTSKFMLFVNPFTNVGIWNGTVVSTPATAGIPDVNAKNWNNLTTVALPLIPTVAGRTLDCSAGGEAGLDWANIGSPTTTQALTGTTIADTQKVDVNTIKTQTVTCGAGVTVLASVGTAATSTAQTGDGFARLGAPVGASISIDIAGVQSDTDNIQTRLPAALVSGRIDASVGAMAADTLTASALAADAVAEIQSGLSTLTAAGVRSAIGMASANLDTQLAALDADVLTRLATSGYTAPLSASGTRAAVGLATANLDTQLAAIQADTDDIQTRIPVALVGGLMNSTSVVTGDFSVTMKTSIGTAVAASAVASVTGNVGGSVGSVVSGVALSSGGLDAVQIEAGLNSRQALSLIASALAGLLSGAGSTSVTIQGAGVATQRIVATVDSVGNRTAITLTPPA